MKAVIFARGKGTRMQQQDEVPGLTEDQARAADLGLKSMMPLPRPFLDYVLSALADAGCREACLVVSPDDEIIRPHYATHPAERLRVSCAVQERPRGTADALLAASDFTGGDPFLALNADNYYPAPVIRSLVTLAGPGLPAFRRSTLVRHGNIDPDRVRAFAILSIDDEGYLADIIEKPDPQTAAAFGDDFFVSMNCWRFDDRIFDACRAIPASPRGEFELPNAVRHAIQSMGCRFRAVPTDDGVLDLSRRRDIPEVARRLATVEPRP